MAQLKEGSIIKKSTGDEVIATLNDIPTLNDMPTDLSQLNQDENHRLVTDAEKAKLDEFIYLRTLTQAQYDALSSTEKDRVDVWYGIYEE